MKNEKIVRSAMDHAAVFVQVDGQFIDVVYETDMNDNPVFVLTAGVEYFEKSSMETDFFETVENTLEQEIFDAEPMKYIQYYKSLGVAE